MTLVRRQLAAFTLSALLVPGILVPEVLEAGDAKPPQEPSSPASSAEANPQTNRQDDQPADYSGKRSRVRLGGISVGAGFGYSSGPAWGRGYGGPGYGYWGPGAWNSMFWDPWLGPGMWPAMSFVHPGYWNGFAPGPGGGEVELRTPNKEDTVTIDGAYAGVAKDLKSFWLEPGVYVVGVSDEDGNVFEKKIYVLSGKTLRLNAVLAPAATDAETEPSASSDASGRKESATP